MKGDEVLQKQKARFKGHCAGWGHVLVMGPTVLVNLQLDLFSSLVHWEW